MESAGSVNESVPWFYNFPKVAVVKLGRGNNDNFTPGVFFALGPLARLEEGIVSVNKEGLPTFIDRDRPEKEVGHCARGGSIGAGVLFLRVAVRSSSPRLVTILYCDQTRTA